MFIERIVEWNNARGLLNNGADVANEASLIVEEVIEMISDAKSSDARDVAKRFVAYWMKPDKITDERAIDALCDVIVYAVGGIKKLGYDPNVALDETLKEIESREGKLVEGKFVKDLSEDAKNKWYKADYSKAKV